MNRLCKSFVSLAMVSCLTMSCRGEDSVAAPTEGDGQASAQAVEQAAGEPEASAESAEEQIFATADVKDDARDANPGLEDLDRATQLKVAAEGLSDLNDAIDHLETALEKGLDADNSEYAEDLLVATLMQRASTFSAAVLERPLADPRRDPRWMQIRQYALTDLGRVTTLDPDLWDAYLLIGRLQALPLGDPRAARREFTRVIDAPSATKVQRAAALALRGTIQKDDERKLDDFNRAIELDPDTSEYHRFRAQHYYTQEEFDKALVDVDRSLEIEPDHAGSHELRGMILLGLERWDDALASFDRASELAPEATLPYQHRAELYRLQGNLDKAVQQLSKALELAPDNAATLLLRAGLYFQMDKADLAIADVEEVIRRQPQLLQAHLMRAELYAATDRLDEAIKQLERLVQLVPGQKQLLQQLATYYVMGGRLQESIDTYSRVIELDDAAVGPLRGRGDAYLGIGKHAEAIADFNRALELDDENAGVLNNLAWVLATSPVDELRDGKRAVELADKACGLTAYSVPHILSTLAAAYAETGDFENAIKWSQKAVELGKDDATLPQLKEELASYQAGEPVREMQQLEDESQPASSGDQTFAPPSVLPAPARTADF